MTDRDDRWGEFLRRANRGDGTAYAAFLTELLPVVRRLVSARGGGLAAEIEDIVQEVLMAIHTKRHTWRESEPVTPWLYAIARYKTADAGRRRRSAGVSVPVEDLADELPGEAGEIMAVRDLGRLLDGIDHRAARIVREVGVEGASAAEVGARLGMSEGAVRVAYHRAMTELRKRVAAEELQR